MLDYASKGIPAPEIYTLTTQQCILRCNLYIFSEIKEKRKEKQQLELSDERMNEQTDGRTDE